MRDLTCYLSSVCGIDGDDDHDFDNCANKKFNLLNAHAPTTRYKPFLPLLFANKFILFAFSFALKCTRLPKIGKKRKQKWNQN